MKSYDLYQIMVNPRNPAEAGNRFWASYATLAEAKTVARKELRGVHWAIYETKLVAQDAAKLLAD